MGSHCSWKELRLETKLVRRNPKLILLKKTKNIQNQIEHFLSIHDEQTNLSDAIKNFVVSFFQYVLDIYQFQLAASIIPMMFVSSTLYVCFNTSFFMFLKFEI